MEICVAGWYFHEPLSAALTACGMPVFYSCHRSAPEGFTLPHAVTRNVGLEFGCYDYFLKNKWAGDCVLFLHDDTRITQEALEAVTGIEFDQAFLFGSEPEAQGNGQAHGRAFFMSARLLARLLEDGGFWYDEGPLTSVAIPQTTEDEPDFHNAGILTYRAWLTSVSKRFNVRQSIVVKGLKNGYRGQV